MSDERGTAMFELLVLGFAILGVFLPAVLALSGMAGAKGMADTIAVDAATWYARHGQLPTIEEEDVVVTVTERPEGIQVRVTVDAFVVGIGGTRLTVPVTSAADVPISPYRSGR